MNESYICFRRREIKSVRKTRASQATSSDKLLRLQSELAQSLELAKTLLARENLKKENAQQVVQVWDKRLEFAELKRKFPALGTKEDEELLYEKERVAKKPRVESLKCDCVFLVPSVLTDLFLTAALGSGSAPKRTATLVPLLSKPKLPSAQESVSATSTPQSNAILHDAKNGIMATKISSRYCLGRLLSLHTC